MKLNSDIRSGLSIVAILLLLVGLLYYIFGNDDSYRWNTSYKSDETQPYDTDILLQLMQTKYDIKQIDKTDISVFLNKENTNQQHKTYFVVNSGLYCTAQDAEMLYQMAEQGNTLAIFTEEIPFELLLHDLECIDYSEEENTIYYSSYNSFNDTYITANFEQANFKTQKGYPFFYQYRNEKNNYYWYYVGNSFCKTIDYEVLGEINPNRPNFIRIKVGKGQILLHSNPLFFTNLHLVRPEGFEYAEKVLSYIPEGEVYWDKQNQPIRVEKTNFSGHKKETPLSYILNQRSLRWALYLLYVAVILFLIFNLWRKQKAIPVKFQQKNTSLEFIQNVGTLYYDNKNNKKLAEKMMQYFLNKVRLDYYIKDKDTQKIIEKLALKTQVDIQIIKSIFSTYKLMQSKTEITDEALLRFYNRIEKFNQATKK